ncbi:MAG: GTP cyclohydrolase FolE2 [Nitrospinota bacterium]
MIDVQSQRDDRKVVLKKVGVKNLHYPITVRDKAKGEQHTTATLNMYVEVPHQFKGTHMSRFVEILNQFRSGVSIGRFHDILEAMRMRLDAKAGHLEIAFPYFIEKTAPVTGIPAIMDYDCLFSGTSGPGKKRDFVLGVTVPVSTLCPCSKTISDYGAHNQRGLITVRARIRESVWLEDLIDLIEEKAVNDIFPLLKRKDEKFVTERAYENPMFVEDVVREVYGALSENPNFTWFSVECENFESIHNHNAYAYTEFQRKPSELKKAPMAAVSDNHRRNNRGKKAPAHTTTARAAQKSSNGRRPAGRASGARRKSADLLVR